MGYATPLLTERYKWLYEASDTIIDTVSSVGTTSSTSYVMIKEYDLTRCHSNSILRVTVVMDSAIDRGHTNWGKITDQDNNTLVEESDGTPLTNLTISVDQTIGDITSFKIWGKVTLGTATVRFNDLRIRGTLLGQYANIDFPTLEEV